MKFYFVNTTPVLVKCLEDAIAEVAPYLPNQIKMSVINRPLRDFVISKDPENTAIVTPANSFSFMGGGFDKAVLSLISEDHKKERDVETAIQNYSLLQNHGFLIPGSAHLVRISEIPYTSGSLAVNKGVLTLIQVPTMEVPGPILHEKAFYSTWAALTSLTSLSDIEAAVFPAFGAGFGGVPPGTCARLMVGALALWYMPAPSPLARSAGVLLYLRKDYRKLGKSSDLAAIEQFYTEHGKSSFTQTGKEAQHWPLPWHRMVKGLNWVQNQSP